MDPKILTEIEAEAAKHAARADMPGAEPHPDAYWLELIGDLTRKAYGQSEPRFQRTMVKVAGAALAALTAHAGQGG